MSDKQIVERNGVSMDRHSSGIDWNNDEAVVRAAEPNTPKDVGYERNWKEIRRVMPSVVAFERENRPTGKFKHSPWKNAAARASEVEVANKVPAPLTEDAPKMFCFYCKAEVVQEGSARWRHLDEVALKLFVGDGLPHNGSPFPTSAPVGEREGEFDKWWNPIKETLYFLQDAEVERATLSARQGWDAHAALASKPSPEGIPERPKPIDSISLHRYKGVDVEAYIATVEALLSAKDASLKQADLAIAEWESREAAVCSEEETFEHVISGLRALEQFWVKPFDDERKLREAAEAEISALKLSSARIEEETLRKALESVSKERLEDHDKFLAMMYQNQESVSGVVYSRAIRDAENAILSLIPTSPESKESKQ